MRNWHIFFITILVALLALSGCNKNETEDMANYVNPNYPIISLVDQDNSDITVDNVTNENIYTILNNLTYIYVCSGDILLARDDPTFWTVPESVNAEFNSIDIYLSPVRQESFYKTYFPYDISKQESGLEEIIYDNYQAVIYYTRYPTARWEDGYEYTYAVQHDKGIVFPASLFEEYTNALGFDLEGDSYSTKTIINREIIESMTSEQKMALIQLLSKTYELYTTTNLPDFVSQENAMN